MMIQKTDIYKLLGVTNDHFKKWRKGGKVIYDGRVIDLSIPSNNDFFIDQCEKKGIDTNDLYALSEIDHSIKNEDVETEPTKKEKKKLPTDNDGQPLTLSQIKTTTEIELNEIKIEKESIDLAKKLGEVIEVESSRNIMQIVVSEFQNGNREDVKMLIDELCEAYGVPYTKRVDYQRQVDERMNRRAKTVKEIISTEIEKSIDDYRITRRRGESA